MGSQRVRHGWAIELNWTELIHINSLSSNETTPPPLTQPGLFLRCSGRNFCFPDTFSIPLIKIFYVLESKPFNFKLRYVLKCHCPSGASILMYVPMKVWLLPDSYLRKGLAGWGKACEEIKGRWGADWRSQGTPKLKKKSWFHKLALNCPEYNITFF